MDVDNLDIRRAIALLRTSYLPTPEDASHFQARITQTADAIDEIDRELANLQVLINKLKNRRERLQLSHDVARAHIAPIRRIPVEILQNILEHAIPQYYHEALSLGCSHWKEIDAKSIHGDQRHIRKALRLVCYSWSNIISNTPGFWSSLMTSLTFEKQWSQQTVCSHDFPSVHHGAIDAVIIDNGDSDVDSMRFWPIILANIDKIRTLDEGGGCWGCTGFWGRIITLDQRTDFPVLRMLRVEKSGHLYPEGIQSDVAKIHAPKLRWLSLGLPSSYTLPSFTIDTLHSLNALILDTPSWVHDTIMDALTFCQGLAFFQWEFLDLNGMPVGPPPTLHFPVLKELRLAIKNGVWSEAEQRHIPFINATIVESIVLTLNPYPNASLQGPNTPWFDGPHTSWLQGSQKDIINIIQPILTLDKSFISYIKLSGFDTTDERVSTLLLGHSFPVLRQMTFENTLLASRLLLSLMPCGPLYDTILNYHPCLDQVHFGDGCSLKVALGAEPDVADTPSTISLRLFGGMSRTPQSISDVFDITSNEKDWQKQLTPEAINDIHKLKELYGDRSNVFGIPLSHAFHATVDKEEARSTDWLSAAGY